MSIDSDLENDMELHHDVEDEKTVDEDDKVEKEENDNDKEEEGGETEDVDEDADKRYWEAKAKEGVQKVYLVISEAVDNINKFTQPKKKNQATRDIRLSFQHDARLVDGVVKAGAYCRWCL